MNSEGYHWAKQKGQVSWDQKYEELKAFHKLHGHCNVPPKYQANTALGRWISTQRSQLKDWKGGLVTKMTKARYDKLCALNFQFDRLTGRRTNVVNEALQENQNAEVDESEVV